MDATALHNKVALITGASKGLGKAMALSLSEAGAAVALVSRDREKLEAVRDEITQAGGKAHVFLADVRDEASVGKLEAEVSSALGKVQILVNNAGINIRKNLVDFSLPEWQSVINTNLTSVFLMCRAFAPHMKGSGYGRILCITSIMSHVSLPQRSAYSASKAGGARIDTGARVGTGARRHNGERHQSGSFWNRDECAGDEQPRIERAVSGEHSTGQVGKARGHRDACCVSLLGGGRLHHRDRHPD